MKWLSRLGLLAASSLLAASFLTPTPVSRAAEATNCGGNTSFFTLQPWTAYLPCREGVGPVIESFKDVTGLAFWAADSLLKLIAYIALAMVIWGAIKYIKSNGEPQQINEAKNTIIQAVAGLGICIASVAIVNFVAGVF